MLYLFHGIWALIADSFTADCLTHCDASLSTSDWHDAGAHRHDDREQARPKALADPWWVCIQVQIWLTAVKFFGFDGCSTPLHSVWGQNSNRNQTVVLLAATRPEHPKPSTSPLSCPHFCNAHWIQTMTQQQEQQEADTNPAPLVVREFWQLSLLWLYSVTWGELCMQACERFPKEEANFFSGKGDKINKPILSSMCARMSHE